MKLQSLQNFLSVLNMFSDCPQLMKNSISFKIILNEVTKIANIPKCSKYDIRIILNDFTLLIELSECPKYLL